VPVAVLLLGLTAGVTVGVLTATGLLFGGDERSALAEITPVPDVIGLTKEEAVRVLTAAHLRPIIRYTRRTSGQPSSRVVSATGQVMIAPRGGHPISVGGGHSVGVLSEGDRVQILVSR
jgi:hypothetical protein